MREKITVIGILVVLVLVVMGLLIAPQFAVTSSTAPNTATPSLTDIVQDISNLDVKVGALRAEVKQCKQPAQQATSQELIEQYYRGIYDTCRYVLGGSPDQCNEVNAKIHAKNGHTSKSEGFKWPVAVEGVQ